MGSGNDMITTGSGGRSPLVKPRCAKEIDLSLGRQEWSDLCSCIDGGDEICDNNADSDEENSNDDDDDYDDVDDDDFD